jgi:Zn-dependent peptidase ImmA (M78 family)
VPGKDQYTGWKRARQCREALGLGPTAPLACLLTTVEDTGAAVVIGRLRDDLAGAYVPLGRLRLLFVDATATRGRQRFTLAHELGHLRMAHAGRTADTSRTLADTGYDPLEVQANAFAGELLVPRAALEELVTEDPTLEQVVVLASRYGTSAPALVVRLAIAGCVSPAREQRLKEEIAAGHHVELQQHLGLEGPDDRLARIEQLPYVSPALRDSALGDVLEGRCSIEDAAVVSGVRCEAFARAVELLAGPTDAGP